MKLKINVLHKNIISNRDLPKDKHKPVIEVDLGSANTVFYNLYQGSYGLTVLSDKLLGKVWMEEHIRDRGKTERNTLGSWKIIHVNQHHIKNNLAGKKVKPLITIKLGNKVLYADKVKVLGPSQVVYLDKPLSCGAEVVLKTMCDIEVTNPQFYTEL